MEFTTDSSALVKHVVSVGVLSESPLSVLDIGCSGGISQTWRVFEPALIAVGIDPVSAECQRLSAKEKNPAVRYVAAYVGLPDDHPFVLKRGGNDYWGGNPFPRSSAQAASDILSRSIAQDQRLAVLNDWVDGSLSASPENKLAVDDVAKQHFSMGIDFLKVDVDGQDMDVLLSGENTIRKTPVLGLALEVNYCGGIRETDHTFHNTDRLMRSWGYDLFGLTVRHYSSSALPAPFAYRIPAQTITGRPLQGDAVYLLDPVANPQLLETLSAERLLKLACLFESFGLPDHSAELILAASGKLSAICDPDMLLDILARQADPSVSGYKDYMQRFQSDPTSFYPS